MKKYLYTIITLFAAFLTSCSIQESETTIKNNAEEPEFYASIEDASTRVFADENLSVLWNADDRVSIFNKNTYNQQYKFLGETGDNAGGFNKVDVAEFVTGKPITNVVSVYPYQEDTKISEDGVLTVTLPAEQTYSENTFGIGTNMMVSVSSDNFLQYKNVGGYLRLKLYGEGVAISTIILTGNNGEKLAGKAIITVSSDGAPSVQMANDANTGVSLNCNRSVLLGSSSEKSTDFWLVLPPVTFSKGFTITVKKKNGQTFTKKTSSPVTITRNNLLNMAPFEVEMEGTQPNNVIYYTSKDSTIITPSSKIMGSSRSLSIISNDYKEGEGIMVFDGDITHLMESSFENCTNLSSIILPQSIYYIGSNAFKNCASLSSISLPERITYIGPGAFHNCASISSITLPEGISRILQNAFYNCASLSSITLPEGITSIEQYAFYNCSSLSSVSLPEGITNISRSVFYNCASLSSINLPESITSIESSAFYNCHNLTSIVLPSGLKTIGGFAFEECTSLASITIPKGVTSIGPYAFSNCTNLSCDIIIPESITLIEGGVFYKCSGITGISLPEGLISIGVEAFMGCSEVDGTITLPNSVTNIGKDAFNGCKKLKKININSISPPNGGERMFSNTNVCPIFIPKGSEELYANAEYWKNYSLRMRVEGSEASIAYCSSDYSKDGEVVQLQQASVGKGINIIFLGDGFLDRDMAPGGKYEIKMRETMEQFFSFEPYYSLRNRFNIYAVKVVSENDIFFDDNSNRALSYDQGDTLIRFWTTKCKEYGERVPNPYKQPLKIGVVFNSNATIGRSFCTMNIQEEYCYAFILGIDDNIINHELGGHGFAFLADEYIEYSGKFSGQTSLDNNYYSFGFGANVDWRSDPNEVRWARFLKDPRYAYEGLGVYEGGYLYAHGIYRATENSMMRYNDTPFNAPSREQIYKMIMKYSEGEDWVYDYEEFVKADERGRMEAAEELGPWKSPRRNTRSQTQAESQHHPPVLIDDSVKAVGIDKDGNVIKVR